MEEEEEEEEEEREFNQRSGNGEHGLVDKNRQHWR
jgi:hypothetical protein